jgi:hypothetical protein
VGGLLPDHVHAAAVSAEADAHKRALLAFPGVVPKPAKAARASTPALGGQAEGQGGSGGGAAAD